MSEERPDGAFLCAVPASTGSSIIKLGHGSGGKMTSNLIENVFLPVLGNDILSELEDAALVNVPGTALAVTTDAYVVSPIFFPGGDIGSLSVHGTVNDLSMRGARPLFITASFILEEGLPIEDLTKVIASFQAACEKSNIKLIAADTKVVNKGAADRLFITTTGIGLIEKQPAPSANRAQPGDCVLISGDIGRHGVAIMSSREGLDLETDIVSDSAPLNSVIRELLAYNCEIHCLRDVTRGGLASVLNELASASKVGIIVEEEKIKVHPQVSAVCDLLGLDPLYVACEGRFVAIVPQHCVDEICSIMVEQEFAQGACMIGVVIADHPGRVVLRSRVGGRRIVDKLSGEQLPRIC